MMHLYWVRYVFVFDEFDFYVIGPKYISDGVSRNTSTDAAGHLVGCGEFFTSNHAIA